MNDNGSTCKCQEHAVSEPVPQTAVPPLQPVSLDEVSQFLTIVDGAVGFYGKVTQTPDNGVNVHLNANGRRFVYRLLSMHDDAIEALGNRFPVDVIGAFRPTRAFRDDDPQSINQSYTIEGYAIAVEPWTLPGRDSRTGLISSSGITLESPFVRKAAKVLGFEGSSLSTVQQQVLFQVFAEGSQLVNQVLRSSTSASQLFGVLRTALTAEFLVQHYLLGELHYSLTSIDIVPAKPGVQTGYVHLIFRYLQSGGMNVRAFLSTVSLRSREDLSISAPPTSFEEIAPEQWSSEECAACRSRCAASATRCIKAVSGHGPAAVSAIADCLLEAAKCYSGCGCF